VSLHPLSHVNERVSLVSTVADNSTRALTTDNTYEDITGTEITFVAEGGRAYIYVFTGMWRTASANFIHHNVRALVDGGSTGVSPTVNVIAQEDTSVSGERFTSTALVYVTGLDAESHAIKWQSSDGGSNVNRTFECTLCYLFQV
jgi:hypothetical protein